MSKLYSIGEAARLVGRSEGTLRRWEREGKIKPQRVGGDRIYTDDDIKKMRTFCQVLGTGTL